MAQWSGHRAIVSFLTAHASLCGEAGRDPKIQVRVLAESIFSSVRSTIGKAGGTCQIFDKFTFSHAAPKEFLFFSFDQGENPKTLSNT